MGCTTSITISQASVDTPLHTAIYLPSTDKIVGTSQNYILEFNATTGALERSVKFVSPAYGNMHLGWINGLPAVAVNNDPSVGASTRSVNVRRDIFLIDPTTLEAGVGLGMPLMSGLTGGVQWHFGPHQFVSVGTNVFVLYPFEEYVAIVGFDATDPVNTYDYDYASSGFWSEQLCTDGASMVYTADPGDNAILAYNSSLAYQDWCNVTPWRPVGCEYAGGKVWAVCGNAGLLRIDSLGGTDFAVIDLSPTCGSVRPIRIRHIGGVLYMPCPFRDGVAAYNIGSSGVTWYDGLESPIDVVGTGSKVFAVQSSATGLVEIT